MPVITNQICHPDQLPRMANTLNVDLAQAILNNKLEVFRHHDIAFKCGECLEKRACNAWLDAHPDGAQEAPDYCLNKVLLEELRS